MDQPMRLPPPITATMTAVATVAGVVFFATQIAASPDLVKFPQSYSGGVHYATVHRGNIREELFTSRDAVEAAKKGQPLPSGTVITMEDHRSGRLHRYVVMEKRTGWQKLSPNNASAGDWLFREFRPDKTPNAAEDGRRCMSCHRSQAADDYVFTLEKMKSAN